MFGIFGKDPQISLKEAISSAGEKGYKILFTEIPTDVQEALTLLADKNRQRDAVQTVEVENMVLKKTVLSLDRGLDTIIYKLRCTTMGKRKLSYNLCVKQGPDGKILDQFVEVAE